MAATSFADRRAFRPSPGRFLALLLVVVCPGVWLRAGLATEGFGRNGQRGWWERGAKASLRLPWKTPKEFDTPVYTFTGSLTRSRRGDYIDLPKIGAVTAQVDWFRQLAFTWGVWRVQELHQSTGAYRANGSEIRFSFFARGFFPQINIEAPPPSARVKSRVDVAWTNVSQELRIALPGEALWWSSIKERAYSAVFTQTFFDRTSLKAWGRHTNYDKRIRLLVNTNRLVYLSQVEAPAEPERLTGYLRGSWGAGVEQKITRWMTVAGAWARFEYKKSPLHHAADATGRLSLRLGPLSLFGDYRVFRPHGMPSSEYAGAGATLEF